VVLTAHVLFSMVVLFACFFLLVNPQIKEEAIALAQGIAKSITPSSPAGSVGLFVPFVTPELSGVFTAPTKLKSMCIMWALAGHSQRREIVQESDEYINAHCRLWISQRMNAMLCGGETAAKYEQNLVRGVCVRYTCARDWREFPHSKCAPTW
jgi:triosephosphate isomerase